VVPIEDAEMIFLILTNYWDWEIDPVEYQKLLDSKQPVVVFDFWEIGWDKDASGLPFPELNPFFHRTKAYFKRELKKNDVHGWFPIDFYNDWTWPTTDTFEEFNARPIDLLMCYGLSHPMRPKVHAAIMASGLWTYIDQPEYMEHEKGPFALCMFRPHYARVSQENLLPLQAQAKITISIPGAAIKCFRSLEIINSAMAKPIDNLVWQAGWSDENCIQIDGEAKDWPQKLKEHLADPEVLYQKYLNGISVAHESKPEVVWNTYLLPLITK